MSTEKIKMQIKIRKQVGRKGKEWESLLMSAPHSGLTKHHVTLMSTFVNNCSLCVHIILQMMMQQWGALKNDSTLQMQLELKKTKKTQGLQNVLLSISNYRCDVNATILTTSHGLVWEDAVVCDKKTEIGVTCIAVEHRGGWRPSNTFFSTIK